MADKRNNSSSDIISGLPCELLCYTFGFLPLKDAARTSVLSAKFQHIWCGIDRVDLQAISIREEPLSLLETLNVRHLILKTCSHLFKFDGICRFVLKSCPLLEILTINNPVRIFPDYVPPFELNPEEFWTKNLIILSCMETSLKVVEVFGFQGTGNEVLMLQYMILFESVLEEVNLYLSEEDDGYGGNRENYRKIAEWILQRNIERASHKLSISIYSREGYVYEVKYNSAAACAQFGFQFGKFLDEYEYVISCQTVYMLCKDLFFSSVFFFLEERIYKWSQNVKFGIDIYK